MLTQKNVRRYSAARELIAYSLLIIGKRLNGNTRQRILCMAHSAAPGLIWG